MDSSEFSLCEEYESGVSPKLEAEKSSVFEDTHCKALKKDHFPDELHLESHGEHGETYNWTEVAPIDSHDDDWITKSPRFEMNDVDLAPESEQCNVQVKDCHVEESLHHITEEEVVNLFFCTACDVHLKDKKAYHNHTRSMVHTVKAGELVNDEASQRDVQISASEQNISTAMQAESKESFQVEAEESTGGEAENQLLLLDALDSSDSDSDDCSWLKDAEGEAFYCEVCECCMTGASSYQSHTEGSRHLKNVKNVSLGVPIKKPKGKLAVGSHLAKVVDRKPKIQDMIDNCKEALIGLQYITEYCHDSDSVEPRYACSLCEAMCDIRTVVGHLTGLRHRVKYMKKKGYTNYIILVQQTNRKSCQSSAAEAYSVEIEAKEGRQKMVVRLEEGFVASAPLTDQLNPDQSSSTNKEDERMSDANLSQKGSSEAVKLANDPFRKFVASTCKEQPRKHSRNFSSGEKREREKPRQLPNPYADAAELSLNVYPMRIRSSHGQFVSSNTRFRKDFPPPRMSPSMPTRLLSPPTSHHFSANHPDAPLSSNFHTRTGQSQPPNPVTSRLPPPRLPPPVQPFIAPVHLPPPVASVYQQPPPTSLYLSAPVRFSPDVSGSQHVSSFPSKPIHGEPYKVPPPLQVSSAFGQVPSLTPPPSRGLLGPPPSRAPVGPPPSRVPVGPPPSRGPSMPWGLPHQAQGPLPMVVQPLSSGPPPSMGPPPMSSIRPPLSMGPILLSSGLPSSMGPPPLSSIPPPSMGQPPMSAGPPPSMGPPPLMPPQSLVPPPAYTPPPSVGLPAGPYSFSASVLARPISLNCSYDVSRLPPNKAPLDPYTARQPEPMYGTDRCALPDSSLGRPLGAVTSQLPRETFTSPPPILHPPTTTYSNCSPDPFNQYSGLRPSFREENFPPPPKRSLYDGVQSYNQLVDRHSVGNLASEVSGRLADSEQEAFEMSRVIAEAVLKYKSSKSHPQMLCAWAELRIAKSTTGKKRERPYSHGLVGGSSSKPLDQRPAAALRS